MGACLCFYCGMVWPLLHSLAARLAGDAADGLVALHRRLLYPRYDDVLPPDPEAHPDEYSSRATGANRTQPSDLSQFLAGDFWLNMEQGLNQESLEACLKDIPTSKE